MEAISLNPIGYVVSPVTDVKDMPPGGVAAEIEVLPQYQPYCKFGCLAPLLLPLLFQFQLVQRLTQHQDFP